MRKSILVAAGAAMLVSVPALAVGLGDLAKVVLNNKSVLKKAETSCKSNGFALTSQDNSIITTAVEAVKKAVPEAQFLSLDNSANSAANTASQAPTFCTETKAKKKGLLGKIGSAGKKLVAKSVLGI